MGAREEVQKRIERKRSEIAEFAAKIRDAEIYIQAMEDTLKLLPKEHNQELTAELRPGSRVARARDFLRQAGKPVHISEILNGIGEKMTRETRAALSGSIGAYVRDGVIFTRPGPNVFGLIEFKNGGSAARSVPPPGFGEDEADESDAFSSDDLPEFLKP